MIFTQSLQRIDASNPTEAIKKMANHIKYIQEQLEYTLTNLDSNNIIEIDTDKTVVGDSEGSTNLGSFISIKGENGESFTVGKNLDGNFEFTIRGKDKTQMMRIDENGQLIITGNTYLAIDGGEW